MQIPLIDNALFIDNSTLELLRCPRLLELKWIHKKVPVAVRAGANFGSTMHRGLETRYTLCGTGPVLADHVPLINDSMLQWLNEHPQPENEFRNYAHACAMMREYNQQYGQEDFKILTTEKEKPIVESSFALPFGLLVYYGNEHVKTEAWDGTIKCFEYVTNQPNVTKVVKIYYTGKIDLGIEDNTGIWSFDHKTAFQFGESFINQMDMDGGQLGYMWALQQVTGKKAAGYIIDAIRVRRPKKSDDPLSGSIDKTDFFRRPFMKQQEQLDEWKTDVLHMIQNIANMAEQDYMPRHRSQCVTKYGSCDFFDVCNTPLSQRDLILNSGNYEENTWSPLKQVEE